VVEHCLPLVKVLYLRNWSIRDGDIKNLLLGIHMGSGVFKLVKSRAIANVGQYQNKIFDKNLLPFVETNVALFNRATGIADNTQSNRRDTPEQLLNRRSEGSVPS
jgi:hypothetical protein